MQAMVQQKVRVVCLSLLGFSHVLWAIDVCCPGRVPSDYAQLLWR